MGKSKVAASRLRRSASEKTLGEVNRGDQPRKSCAAKEANLNITQSKTIEHIDDAVDDCYSNINTTLSESKCNIKEQEQGNLLETTSPRIKERQEQEQEQEQEQDGRPRAKRKSKVAASRLRRSASEKT